MSDLIKPNRLAELLKKHNIVRNPIAEGIIREAVVTSSPEQIIISASGGITYNAEQSAFITLASSGKSAVLIGAAGTGKTTCMKGAVSALLQSSRIPPMQDIDAHKYLIQNTPGVILCSFTRRAVRNLRRAVSDDIKSNCITIHKLLEYSPIQYEVFDPETSSYRNTMRFEPTRNASHPLPASIRTIIIDESSMVSLELFTEIYDALPYKGEVQFIFLGDIQQLPPVFGSAVLGYKMNELPLIELTQVYRQALESPIIRLAHRILSGVPIPSDEFAAWKYENQLTIHPWKKKLHHEVALLTIAKFFTTAFTSGSYDPEEDMILCPFNKAFGTIELNKHIANHIANSQSRIVYEVVAGYNKHYMSVGDKVLFEKEDAEIIRIVRNAGHTGKQAQKESITLDYWGYNSNPNEQNCVNEFDLDSIDAMLDAASSIDSSERVTSSSHIITVRMLDSEEEISIDSAAEVNNMLLAYALTVHKAQGSEWRKVFVTLHQSHNTMVQRELLYTAVTRAREELYVICEPDHFEKGIKGQRIVGNTLAEKAEYFKGKMNSRGEA